MRNKKTTTTPPVDIPINYTPPPVEGKTSPLRAGGYRLVFEVKDTHDTGALYRASIPVLANNQASRPLLLNVKIMRDQEIDNKCAPGALLNSYPILPYDLDIEEHYKIHTALIMPCEHL